MSRILGVMRRLSWVVPDIEDAMQHWIRRLGVGPFFHVPHLKPDSFQFEGKNSAVDLSIALAYSGPVQIELIQQHNTAPSMYQTALSAGHSGPHHVGFFSTEFDAMTQKMLLSGHGIGQSGRVLGDCRFAHFATRNQPGIIVELIELDDALAAAFDAFKTAASDWDGSEPVRDLPL